MATGLSLDEANCLIQEMRLTGELQVACVNAPDNVTLSGSVEGIEKVSLDLQARNKFCRRLETGGRVDRMHDSGKICEKCATSCSVTELRPARARAEVLARRLDRDAPAL